MSFSIKNTSAAFQPVYKPEPVKSKNKTSLGEKDEKDETKSIPHVHKNQSSSGGFQVRHDATNQADYY
jgi:hypothetical protein